MGGIAGIFHCGTTKPVDPTRVGRMCDALVHRGPDGSGVWTAQGVGLGSCRLAVVDRTEAAQPLRSADGRAVLVFDGELTNLRQLRRELGALGAEFRTEGDGEGVLAAWQRWGVECLRRLHGAFAFALYDVQARTLLLARDRLGVKPLVTAQLADGSLAFASELKGLLAHPLLRREVDPRAIDDFLAWGFVPDHRSILKGVEKLAAGHFRLLRHGKRPGASQCWWDVSFAERRRGSDRDLEAELLHHLREAVIGAMRAERRVGAIATGELGSSSVIAMMAEASRTPVPTSAIAIEGAPAALARAATVATLCGTDHRTRALGPTGGEVLNALAAMFDEPFAGLAAVPSWRACELAHERVAVALTGDGADTTLGSSRHLAWQHHADRLHAMLPSALERTLPTALARGAANGYVRRLAVAGPAVREGLYGAELIRALDGYRAEQPVQTLHGSAPARSGLDRAHYADLKVVLAGATLARLDRTSMAVGLEARAPLADHRLVEFAASLPERVRFGGGYGAWLLRRAMRRYLPDDVRAPLRQAPAVPVAAWLRGPLAGEAAAIAGRAALARTGWFDTGRLLELVQTQRAGSADHARWLWQLMVLDRSLVGLGLIA